MTKEEANSTESKTTTEKPTAAKKGTATDPSVDEATSAEVSTKDKVAESQDIIQKYVKWSFGVGLIPAPFIDLVALTGIQMKMLADISEVYGFKFSDNKYKSAVSSLIGGAIPQSIGKVGASSFLKSIPVIGTAISVTTMPLISAGATYAVGSVFIRHFESGGTLLDLDVEAMKTEVKTVSDKFKKDKSGDKTKSDDQDAA